MNRLISFLQQIPKKAKAMDRQTILKKAHLRDLQVPFYQ